MTKHLIVVAVVFAVAAGAAAQEITTGWLVRTSCPTSWVQANTRPARPDTYSVLIVDGYRLSATQAELDSAFTTSGVLDQMARDAAIASGTVQLRAGAAAAVRCTWRPLGGQP